MPNRHVSCDLMGGLGNQIFQIFATMAYAINNNMSLIFAQKEYLGGTFRNRQTYWNSLFSELKRYTTKHMDDMNAFTLLQEHSFTYKELPKPTEFDKNIMLFGYFQSYKYFDKEYKNIAKYIKLDESRSEVRNMYYKKYENSNVISVHFRMGDYKNLQNCHPILGEDYYINSINFILSKK